MSQYHLNLNFQLVKLSSLKDVKWKTNQVILTEYAPDWRVIIKSTANKIKYFNTLLNSNWATWLGNPDSTQSWNSWKDRKQSTQVTEQHLVFKIATNLHYIHVLVPQQAAALSDPLHK